MLERGVTNDVLLAMSQRGTRLFRNNVAACWTASPQDTKRFPDGSVYLKNARMLHAGLGRGSSDYIGWHPLTITCDKGYSRRLSIFTAIEMKRTVGGRLTEDQSNFLEQVRLAGGMAGVATSAESALELYDQLTGPHASL